MSENNDVFVVEEYSRFVHDSRWVCLQPGTKLSLEQAAEYGLAEKPNKSPGDKPLEQWTGPECDAKAAKLGVDPWDAKAKVADKREALAAWIAEHPPENV